MEKTVYYENEASGSVTFEKEGGFYRIEARCRMIPGICRLYAVQGGTYANLGVPAPDGEGLYLSRRLSPRALGLSPEDARFLLMPGSRTPETAQDPPSPPQDEKRPEKEEPSPAVLEDRWMECENAADFTSDAVLKPLLSALPDVLYRYRGGGIELAVPAGSADAISAVLCLTRFERIRDAEYYVLSLDREGTPAPAAPSSTY